MKTNTIYSIFRQKLLPALLMMGVFTVANGTLPGSRNTVTYYTHQNFFTLGATNPGIFDFVSTKEAQQISTILQELEGIADKMPEIVPLLQSIPDDIGAKVLESAWIDMPQGENPITYHSGTSQLTGLLTSDNSPGISQFLSGPTPNYLDAWPCLKEQVLCFFHTKALYQHNYEPNNKIKLSRQETHRLIPIFELLHRVSEDAIEDAKEYAKECMKFSGKADISYKTFKIATTEAGDHLCEAFQKILDDKKSVHTTQTTQTIKDIQTAIKLDISLRFDSEEKRKELAQTFLKAVSKSTDQAPELKHKLKMLHKKSTALKRLSEGFTSAI